MSLEHMRWEEKDEPQVLNEMCTAGCVSVLKYMFDE